VGALVGPAAVSKKIGDYQIPFNREGDQLHFATTGEYYGPTDRAFKWVDNFTFEDTLIPNGFERGRSAAYFIFRRMSTGTDVIVFLKDLCDMFPAMVGQGHVTGTFAFTKRGMNYGCRIVL
jgi:hypothetical protein